MAADIRFSDIHLVSLRPLMRGCALGFVLFVLLLPSWGAREVAADFRINEVMLRNDTRTGAAFLDEDGSRSGWVELKNVGQVTASLAGWSLADDPAQAGEFVLPAVSLSPGATIIVWLSAKDRAVAGSPLHANFVAPSRADLHLFGPVGHPVDSVVGQPIPIDQSLGRCAENGNAGPYYYKTPTPGQANHYLAAVPFVVAEDQISLTVGVPHQLRVWPDVAVTWASNNPKVQVSSGGVISAAADALAPAGRAVVTATIAGGGYKASIGVTIVDWVANVSRLDLVPIDIADGVLAHDVSGVHFNVGTTLYHSPTVEAAAVAVGTLPRIPTSMSRLLVTPFGNFINIGTQLYASQDFSNWSTAATLAAGGLWHGFDSYWDSTTQTGYVFSAEYSADDPTRTHRVHRGTYPLHGNPSWDVVLDFPSLLDWLIDPGEVDAVRHVHVVTVDPFTGDVFVATGDSNAHSRIYVSQDFGDTFEILGMGDQSWRTVAVWFTAGFVYWSMDTSAGQSIWRVPRSAYHSVNGWPSLTPELSSGTSTPGVRYYVREDATPTRFPVGKGEFFVAAAAIALDSNHRLRAINDTTFDYREQVALLKNGAQWYQGFVLSQQGDAVSLVSAEPGASFYRDVRARLFGIKEDGSGGTIVQELTIVRPKQGNSASSVTQVIPQAQDAEGRVFFGSRASAHSHYVGRLDWYDDALAMPPAPSPPVPPPACLPVPEPGRPLLWGAGLGVLVWIHRVRSGLRRPFAVAPGAPAA